MLWIKAFHLIAAICWFAALFYLPRLFVYHAQSTDQVSIDRFKIMEKKLYWGIMVPSAYITLGFGFYLLSLNMASYAGQGWIHAKLVLIFLLFGYHHMCGRMVRSFAADLNKKSHVFYRWFNEVPVVILFGIVVLAVVRPF